MNLESSQIFYWLWDIQNLQLNLSFHSSWYIHIKICFLLTECRCRALTLAILCNRSCHQRSKITDEKAAKGSLAARPRLFEKAGRCAFNLPLRVSASHARRLVTRMLPTYLDVSPNKTQKIRGSVSQSVSQINAKIFCPAEGP